MFPRPVLAATTALTLGLVLSACGSSDEPDAAPSSASSQTASSSTSPSTSASPSEAAGTVVKVTVSGNDLSPNAEKIKVKMGEEVTLDISSDRDGEFHVHSTPEQEIPFTPGDTKATLTFDRPGLVDVEEHESHKLLVQFEVR
ncbi:MAG: hypothetical protein EOO74_03190 [Myxococcales bacterium]|nr:MAG: hypothetical protein EOO74_03190 [Myxococcales bacterium]